MATWTKVSTGLSGNVYQMTYAGSRAFAATSAGVYYSDDNAATWTAATGIGYAFGIVHAGSNTVLVATKTGGVIGGATGKVYRSTDNGVSFSDWSTDFPTDADDTCVNVTALGTYAYAFSTYNGVYRRSLSSGNWAAYNTGMTETFPDTGMAGGQLFTDGTSVFTALYGSGDLDVPRLYKDIAGTWTVVKTLAAAPNNLTKAPAIIGDYLYTASDSGYKVLLSDDDGATWNYVGATLAAYNVAANPNLNYLFGANLTTVSQSINGGTAWTDITGNLPVSNNCYYVYVAGFYLYASLNVEEELYRTPLEVSRPDEVDDTVLSIDGSDDVQLDWTAATNASEYEVYRTDTCQALFTRVDTVTITSAMISGATATNITVGNPDYYTVDMRFYDASGNVYSVTSITGGITVTKQNSGTFSALTAGTVRFLGDYLAQTSLTTYTDTTANENLGYTYNVVSFNALGMAGGYGNTCFTDVNDRIIPLSQ